MCSEGIILKYIQQILLKMLNGIQIYNITIYYYKIFYTETWSKPAQTLHCVLLLQTANTRCKISTHRTLYRLRTSHTVLTYGAVSVGEIAGHEAQLVDHLGEDDDRGPTQAQAGHETVQLAERQPNDE